jgi:hypothetical protein
MVLHIKNYTLHGLISPRDHSNVNHVSSLNLSNTCIKSLAYHLIAPRHYTDLLYKVEEIDRTTYGASVHRRRKVSTEDHSSYVHEVIWSEECPVIVKTRGKYGPWVPL